MGNSNAVVNLSSVTGVPEAVHKQVVEERDYLREFIGSATVDKIQDLETQVKQLLADNNNLQGQVNSFNTWRAELLEQAKQYKLQCDATVAEAAKAHSDGRERQRGYWESEVSSLSSKLNNSNSRVVKLEADNKVLVEQISKLEAELNTELVKVSILESIDGKVDTVLSTLFRVLDIVSKLGNDSSVSKESLVQEIVAEVDKLSIAEECKLVYKLTQEGLTNAEIGQVLWPGLARGPAKVTDRRSRPEYLALVNKEVK